MRSRGRLVNASWTGANPQEQARRTLYGRYFPPCINPRKAGVAKIGRNEPCPCGSGRKYKVCCGTVALPVAVSVSAPRAAGGPPGADGGQSAPSASSAPSAPQRACGPCTACCEGWAEGEIRGHRMSPGRPCHFLTPAPRDPAQASPCTIYEERPESPCRRFVCGWLAPGSDFPEHFRPDLSGFILVPLRWRERPAWVMLPAGRDPDEAALSWMQSRARATGEPFFYERQGERVGYGPPAFQMEMQAKLQRGEKLW